MHLLLTIFAGLIVLGALVMSWAMYHAKPDPREEEEFNEADIYSPSTRLRKAK